MSLASHKYPEVELLDHQAARFLRFLKPLPTVFPRGCTAGRSHQQSADIPLPHLLTSTVCSVTNALCTIAPRLPLTFYFVLLFPLVYFKSLIIYFSPISFFFFLSFFLSFLFFFFFFFAYGTFLSNSSMGSHYND